MPTTQCSLAVDTALGSALDGWQSQQSNEESTRSDKRHLPEAPETLKRRTTAETLKRRTTDQVFCNEETDDRDDEQHCDGTHEASPMTAAMGGMLVDQGQDPSEVKPSTTRSKTSPAATMHEEDPNTDEICVSFLGKEEQGDSRV